MSDETDQAEMRRRLERDGRRTLAIDALLTCLTEGHMPVESRGLFGQFIAPGRGIPCTRCHLVYHIPGPPEAMPRETPIGLVTTMPICTCGHSFSAHATAVAPNHSSECSVSINGLLCDCTVYTWRPPTPLGPRAREYHASDNAIDVGARQPQAAVVYEAACSHLTGPLRAVCDHQAACVCHDTSRGGSCPWRYPGSSDH